MILGGVLGGCGGDAPPNVPPAPVSAAEVERETTRLNEWLDARYEESLAFSPTQQTALGRKTDYDKIDDFSEAEQDRQLAWQRASVEELKRSFDYTALTPEGKTSYDLWVYGLERAEAVQPFRRRFYVFTQMGGQHTGLPQVLINFHAVDDAADMRAYVARIGEVARGIDQNVELARLAAAEGVHAPRFAYDGVRDQAQALITGAPFGGAGDSPLWADASAKIGALATAGKIDAATADELRAAARAALVQRFAPSYGALIGWLESELDSAPQDATGVWNLPDGAAFYEEMLESSTTTAMTADEIHDLGLREVARIRGEMDAIREQVGFEGDLERFFAFVRGDPQFFFSNDDAGREAYLEAARTHIAALEQKLPQYFGLLPKAGLVVKRVEAFREQPGAAQHYVQGTPDGSRPGTYYVHLIDMTAMPKTSLEAVAYHEGLPGHHMQISIAQELTGLPQFRTQAFFTPYTEGWGLYSEALAKEMGGYADPYADFGRLSGEMWRAIRLVVDTGMHSKRWTEQQAVDYFIANSPIAEGQIRAEVRRYLVVPGQATAYKVGMLKIQELRARAERDLGPKVDIRGFHDTVLGGGALPLSILERRVDQWIAASNARTD
jgi:uncharacterized protein (DUF885 family)